MRDLATVARVGGDEFGLVLPDADGRARSRWPRPPARLSRPRPRCAASLRCSAGIACYPEDAKSAGALLQLADGALSWAKESGRGRSRRYDPEHVFVVTEEQREDFAAPDRPARRRAPGLPADRVAGQRRGGRLRGAGALRGQARRCRRRGGSRRPTASGSAPRSRPSRCARRCAAPEPPAGHLPVDQPEPLGAGFGGDRASCCPADLRGVVIEITEEERVLDVERAPAPSRPAARPRRAHRGGRRRRGLRRAAAGDEHARRHHQARPRAGGRRAHRPGQDRADRLARPLRAQHRRGDLRRGHRDARRAARADPPRRGLRAGLGARPPGAPLAARERRGGAAVPRAALGAAQDRRPSGCRQSCGGAPRRHASTRSPCSPGSATMFERTASRARRGRPPGGARGRGARDRRGARLPRRGGQRLPPRLRRHAHRGRRGLGRVDAPAASARSRRATPGPRC